MIKPIESTQSNIPIRDIRDGIIIDKNNNYSKIIEVLPVPFFLKKVSEQNKIGDSFKMLLKSAPSELHIKSMAIKSDLTDQINTVKHNLEKENDENCKRIGQEYVERLKEAQSYGVNRRFFISCPYEETNNGLKGNSFDNIKYNLETNARRIKNNLADCGNETAKFKNEDVYLTKLFYMIYNRDNYLKTPYETYAEEIYSKYKNELNNNEFYIPLADLIAPLKISYENSKYLVVNDTYYKFLYIPSYGYNQNVITGWLNTFVNSFIGVDVDTFLKKVPKENVINSLKRNIGHSKADLSQSSETQDSYDESLSSLSSARSLKDGLSNGEDFYYISTIITVSSTDPEDVDFKLNELKKNARQFDITLKENLFRNEETFNMVMPNAQWDESFYTFKKSKRNVLTDGASSLFPFTTFNILDKNGLYLADDFTGSPVILDQFNRKRFNNPHIFLCGETGAGKTISIMLMALRARVQQIPVYILAPEKEDEFKRVVEAIGGQFISFGPGSSQRINIMEIFKKDETAVDNQNLLDGNYENLSYLANKISTLIDFFELHIQDITMVEKSLLNEALIETYEQKGITSNNESLWADNTHTSYKKMPILSDLVSILEHKKETYRMAKVIKQLTMGNGIHFNGETNVNVNNKFFVIGLEKNSKDMVGLSMFVAMNFCADKIKQNRLENDLFICDEWWKLAFNPIAANKSLEYSKLLRAYGCSMILATQQMSDILAVEDGKYGNAVLNNCAIKIIMSLQDRDAKAVSEMVDLTENEMDAVTRFKPGQALLLAGDNRIMMQFKPSETEKMLTFTDKESLDKYIKLKKEKIELKNDVTDLSSKFE